MTFAENVRPHAADPTEPREQPISDRGSAASPSAPDRLRDVPSDDAPDPQPPASLDDDGFLIPPLSIENRFALRHTLWRLHVEGHEIGRATLRKHRPALRVLARCSSILFVGAPLAALIVWLLNAIPILNDVVRGVVVAALIAPVFALLAPALSAAITWFGDDWEVHTRRQGDHDDQPVRTLIRCFRKPWGGRPRIHILRLGADLAEGDCWYDRRLLRQRFRFWLCGDDSDDPVCDIQATTSEVTGALRSLGIGRRRPTVYRLVEPDTRLLLGELRVTNNDATLHMRPEARDLLPATFTLPFALVVMALRPENA